RASFAGMLVALHPGLVLYSGALMTEPLAALGMMAAILFVVADRSPWRGAAIAGVLLGLTTLVRPNAILIAPILPLLRIEGASEARRTDGLATKLSRLAVRGALVLGLAVATVAPWSL